MAPWRSIIFILAPGREDTGVYWAARCTAYSIIHMVPRIRSDGITICGKEIGYFERGKVLPRCTERGREVKSVHFLR